MNKKQFNARDICAKFITPVLKHAGRDEIITRIREEASVRGMPVTRGPGKRAGYILFIPVAYLRG